MYVRSLHVSYGCKREEKDTVHLMTKGPMVGRYISEDMTSITAHCKCTLCHSVFLHTTSILIHAQATSTMLLCKQGTQGHICIATHLYQHRQCEYVDLS